MRIRSGMVVGIAAVVAFVTIGLTAPASASECTYRLTDDGFPMWSSSCNRTVSPGKFGPLKMGRTTKAKAKTRDYLVYNKFCSRWDGVSAYPDWRSKKGRITAWRGGTKTTKNLRPTHSLKRAKARYPKLKRTGFWPNAYVAGQGWKIYSTKTKNGWLDIYRYNVPGQKDYNFFAVRAPSVRTPIKNWTQDGC